MATLTESITPVAMVANNGQFIAYERSFVAGTPYEVVNGKPVQWFEWILMDSAPIGSGTVSDENGLVRIQNTGTFNWSFDARVGDYFQFTRSPGGLLPAFAQIVTINEWTDTSIDIVIDFPIDSFTIATSTDFFVYYVNRLNRLRPFYITDGTRRYEPNYSAIFVNDATDPTEAIAIDLEQIAISWFPAARPFIDSVNANRNVDLSVGYGKVGEVYDETEAVSVANALEFGFQYNGQNFYSNVLNNQLYRSKWQLVDCRLIEATPFSQDSINENVYNVITTGVNYPAGALVKLNLVSRNPIWLAWQSRYGGYDVWAFNYDQTETLRTESYGQYRQGYSVYDLGKQGATTYTLNTGLISNEYKDWFEDLQNSNKVWFAFDVIVGQDGNDGGINYINHDATNWQECTVEDMAAILGTANSKLIEFQPTIRIPELSKAYRS